MYTYIKMVNKCNQKNKEKLKKEARERYQNLCEEEKEKKGQYHQDRNKNPFEEEKQKNVKYMGNYYLAIRNNFRILILGFWD